MPKSLKRNYKKSQRRNNKRNTFKKSLKRKSLKRTSLKRKSLKRNRKTHRRKNMKRKCLRGGMDEDRQAGRPGASDIYDMTVAGGQGLYGFQHPYRFGPPHGRPAPVPATSATAVFDGAARNLYLSGDPKAEPPPKR